MKEMNKDICKESVFDEVFNTYAKDLKRFLYFKFNCMASAEDVLQDTFIKLWNNCNKVEFAKVKSYIFTIANNLFLDSKRHEVVVRKHEKSYIHQNTNESPEFLMIEEEFLEKVEKAIADLPEKQRIVFMLSRFEKKKYKEIAEKLDISIKTVEKRMHSALLIMREKIGKNI